MFGSNSSSSNKFNAERLQRTLLDLANQPGNDVCADCKARAPRWASHNLGIFICVNCASIHRKIGTHVTKVKSLTLDTWTKEQVENMKQNGNVKSNEYYNPDETRNPPPANFIDSERDSELEKYIRAKYEFKSFIKRSTANTVGIGRFPPLTASSSVDRSAAVAALLGPSRSAASRLSRTPSPSSKTRLQKTTSVAAPVVPPKDTTSTPSQASAAPSVPSSTSASSITRTPARAVSQPAPAPLQQSMLQFSAQPKGVWGDLQSLQSNPNSTSTIDATLPLQVASFPPSQPVGIAASSTTPSSFLTTPGPFNNLSVSPANPFPSSLGQTTGISSATMGRSMSLGTGLSATPLGSSPNYQNGLTPFQSSPMMTGSSLASLSNTPSPNPFAAQPLPAVGGMGAMQGLNGMHGQSQPTYTPSASPFAAQTMLPQQQSQLFQQPQQQPQLFQQSQQQASQMHMFQPQPQPQLFQPQAQLQVPQMGNPYMQSQTPGAPYMNAANPYGSTPSPFANTQPLPQMQQQQQQPFSNTPATNTNPFTSWIQQAPSQQGYSQQWGM